MSEQKTAGNGEVTERTLTGRVVSSKMQKTITVAVERLERPRARDAVVPAEQPAVDADGLGVLEDPLERREIAVDVVEQTEHRATVPLPRLIF